eukprot:GFUD01035427.1.p1 GENE.GFUD01035427.1~~GFUD01035427.1.p1  ORF type:complete len:627 (+),score=232.88 GFUD01035427.1:244-2124(+)
MVQPTTPSWLRLVLTAVISAICCGGIVAAICVWWFHPGTDNNILDNSTEATLDHFADDAGGGGISPLLSAQNPLKAPKPSRSIEGHFSHSAVAVDSVPCAAIGRDVLARKGTAVDAAVAVLFCSGVVTSQSMGIGGGFLMTIYLANGTAVSLVAREKAPAAASRNMFAGSMESSTVGPNSAGVPGEVLGYWEAKQRFGNPDIAWADLVQPSVDLCLTGITVSEHAARMLEKSKEAIKKDPGLRSVFVNKETGEVFKLGDVYNHTKLGDTLKRIAENNGTEFYSGSTALNLVADIARAGGMMTMEDLANYEVSWEDPVEAEIPHTGYRLYSSPPPGSGAIMASILGISGGYSPSPPDKNRPLAWHRFVEACKFAYAKRSLMGDWRQEQLGEEVRELVGNLTSPDWWGEIREKISDQKTRDDPKQYGAEFYSVEDGGTSHTSILSPAGDAVSVTSTINLLYGSKFMSPSTGIILNNQMDDFSYPNILNSFGIPPSENNMVGPGKRPVSSMSPTVVVDKEGRVVAVVGASGGTKITTSVAQVLYRMLYLGQTVKEAVDARRLHHQLVPMEIKYEDGVTRWMVDGLASFGHKMSKKAVGGATVQAILVDSKTGDITANADFRKGGTVEGI